MENFSTLRIDLGINAQKIASQLLINNKSIEDQVSIGIQKAVEEMTDQDVFVDYVKEGTKKAIQSSIDSTINSWEFRSKIQKAITEKLEEKIKEYADNVANKVLKDL